MYFYVSNHKLFNWIQNKFKVVNWFQIVFLREQSQDSVYFLLCNPCCELISNCIFTWAITRQFQFHYLHLRCELISNCIFTWAITSPWYATALAWLLWIDFKLYFYVSNHKHIFWREYNALVVNWFQIVFLREQSQVCCCHL